MASAFRFTRIYPSLLAVLMSVSFAAAQTVFINELHYDNTGADAGEGVEIAGPAGTDLNGYDLVFYNGGNRRSYLTVALTGELPDNAGTGFGLLWFPVTGIQNGNPDGVVLVQRSGEGAGPVHTLSYGGSFTALGGPADGLILPEIPAAESASTPVGFSLQLTGAGMTAGDFTWTGPAASTPGEVNAGQTFIPSGLRRTVLSLTPSLLREGETTTAVLTLNPPPEMPVTFLLNALPAGAAVHPTPVTVPLSGSVTFPVSAALDGVTDGFQQITLRAVDAADIWPAGEAVLAITDADRPVRSSPQALRLMSWNVENGVGAPGGAKFAALREVIERISPDVLLLQEVDHARDFADCRALLAQAGFPFDDTHFATAGDAFAHQQWNGGDFNDSQNLVIASRFPIRQRVQIGRGLTDRKEMARFPLLAVIDLPETPDAADPAVVNVHLKALQSIVPGQANAHGFRRAVELYRVREFLQNEGWTAPGRSVFAGGDFNATDFFPQESAYHTGIDTAAHIFTDGSRLPVSYRLGPELTADGGMTLDYRAFPHSGLKPAGLTAPGLYQADEKTRHTFIGTESRFDYLFVPSAMAEAGLARGETYNSRMEPVADGLPKRLALPADPLLSGTASDHLPVFADVFLKAPPVLTLSLFPASVMEGPEPLTVQAVITVQPPPDAPLRVTLDSWRDDRLALASSGVKPPWSIILTPEQPSVTVSLPVPWSPLVERDRLVMLRASAPDCAPAFRSLEIKNREPAGLLVISQYAETPAGAAPKALELLNISGETLDFSRTPLEIRRYANGSAEFAVIAGASSGSLPDGAVLVLGDALAGNHLVSAGLLPAPADAKPFTGAAEGTVFLNAANQAVYVKDTMDFTGNDALEVRLDGYRCDVFGTIGHDPGAAAWTGGPGNPSTANQNLELRPEILTGGGGFKEPGHRFLSRGAGNQLTGFGIAPAAGRDRYLSWIRTTEATGADRAPNADADGDGRVNLIEFLTAGAEVDWTDWNTVERRGSLVTRAADAWLILAWEHAENPAGPWTPSPGVTGTPENAEFVRWNLSAPAAAEAPRGFWRLRATRP